MTLKEYQPPAISLSVFLQSQFTDSMLPTQAASLLSCGHGPVMKVWCSKYFHGIGCQPFWWQMGCLHMELQRLSDKVVDFVLVMSAGQTLHVYTIYHQHNSITELFPFSFLLVSLVCSHLF